MKQFLLNNLKALALGIILAAAVGSVYAATWTQPTASAPSNNVPTPLHTGDSQVKNGGLSVGSFAAYDNSLFDQKVYFKGIIRGGTPDQTNSQVTIGDADAVTHAAIAGNVTTTDFLQNEAMANPSGTNLCADASGNVVLCTGTASDDRNNVSSQNLMHPRVDYEYDGTPSKKYFSTVCTDLVAKNSLTFIVEGTGDNGELINQSVTVPAGQTCGASDSGSQNGPHTQVGSPTNVCVYWQPDPTYQSQITVDPSIRCR